MPVIFKRYYPARNVFFFLGEGILIFLTVSIAQYLFGEWQQDVTIQALCFFRSALVTMIFQLSLYFFDLYDLGVVSSFFDTAVRITQAFGVGCIILAAIYYVFPATIISSKVFWLGYLSICGVITAWRSIYLLALRRRMFTQPIILIGEGQLAEDIHREITDRMDSGFKIVAYASEKGIDFTIPDGTIYFDSYEKIFEVFKQEKAERVVVALADRRGSTPIKELIDCRMSRGIITQGISFYEELTGKIMVTMAKPDWIIYSDGFNRSRINTSLKRVLDIVSSAFGLIFSLPVTILTALLIKIESPGPVFYTQERVGENGNSFNVIKFRSMAQDAEKNGAVWAKENDSRVTKIGSFIRKTRIDEIPQMWNVLKGEMSFVGPRPERPIFVEQLEIKIPYYSIRHEIKPGLTGWAQVCYPYGASEEDALHKLEYDLYYLKNMSLSIDLWIIFQTIKTVLFKKGSR